MSEAEFTPIVPDPVGGIRPGTLVEMLGDRCRASPDAIAFRFRSETTTYRKLWSVTGRVANRLAEHGVGAGDRVVLVAPNGPDFFAAFYGILRLGGVAVPIFPNSGSDRVAARARLCGARVVVAAGIDSDRGLPDDSDLRVVSDAAADGPELEPKVELGPDALAMLQFTSGSTGEPKGVMLTHGNLVTNVDQMIAGMEITAADVFVSWLPVHHDMGLILMTMVPFRLGASLVLLPASLANVRSWLTTIDRHRGTFTAAPDFAYRLAARTVRDPDALDLTGLRVALNAAEPVRSSTIESFERTFSCPGTMVAGYGLAEATVGVAMSPPGRPPVVDERGLVSVGRPFPGVEVRVVGEDGRSRPAGTIGRIEVRSASNCRGYWDDEVASASLVRGGGFLATGDTGYLDSAGRLFVADREKNIIITAGRNLAPVELEALADRVDGVRAAAAVGIDRGGLEGELAYVFAEVRGRPTETAKRYLAAAVVESIHGSLGLRPGRVVLVTSGSIPRTDNGKVRHAELRRRFLSGELRAAGEILFPAY